MSGTIPLEVRPEGVRLLHDAENGAFQMVVAYRLDRNGRKALVSAGEMQTVISTYFIKRRGAVATGSVAGVAGAG